MVITVRTLAYTTKSLELHNPILDGLEIDQMGLDQLLPHSTSKLIRKAKRNLALTRATGQENGQQFDKYQFHRISRCDTKHKELS